MDEIRKFTVEYCQDTLFDAIVRSVLSVVSVAELLKTVSKLVDSFGSGANNHSEESILKEALGWECEAVLFVK